MQRSENEDLKNILGLGESSIRKSYYPELQKKIDELDREKNYIIDIVNSMSSAIIGIDGDCTITQWNKSAGKNYGIEREDAIGKNIADLLPYLKEIPEKSCNQLTRLFHYYKTRQTRRWKNQLIFEEISVFPLSSADAEGAVIRIDDITEQIRIQETLVQSEKMLSIGGLAAGMAHEINNPLAGIIQTSGVLSVRLQDKSLSGNLQAAEKCGISMEQIGEYLEERGIPKMLLSISESGKRATAIIQNMLHFSRQDSSMKNHDPVELLEKVISIASSDFNLKKHYDFRNIAIEREFEEELPGIPCSESQIQQVLLNLIRNGSEAMGQVERENYKPVFIFRLKKEPAMVRIEVEDNGPGLDEEMKDHIFDAFFTTKPAGEGTGLGLSVSYFIIVDTHKGTMEVESSPGKGARFIIRLPMER